VRTEVVLDVCTNHKIGFLRVKIDTVFNLLELDLRRAQLEVNLVMEIIRHELHSFDRSHRCV